MKIDLDSEEIGSDREGVGVDTVVRTLKRVNSIKLLFSLQLWHRIRRRAQSAATAEASIRQAKAVANAAEAKSVNHILQSFATESLCHLGQSGSLGIRQSEPSG
jgi:hypothetical protein